MSTVNAYTPRYQVAAQTFTIPGTPATDWAAGNWTYTTEWTENGKPLEATTTAPVPGGTPTSDTVRYTYSEYGAGKTAGQPGSTTWIDPAAKYVADTEFDVLGRITKRVLQRNNETTFVREYNYNPQTGALDVIKGGFTGAGLIQHDQYQRDAIGNVTSITDVTSNTKECFLYDDLNRLVRAHTATTSTACKTATGDGPLTAGDRGAVPYDLVYAFDDINRLTTRTDKLAAAGGVATFTPATNGQRPHAVTEVSTTTGGTSTVDSYAYNAYGAMTNRDGDTLTWDGQQRLKQYTYSDTNKGVENYEYWTSNQRVQRQAGGTRTIYLPGLDITIQGANRTITKQITIDGAVVATKVIGAPVEVWWNCADMQNSTTCQTLPGNTGTTQKHDYLPYGATRGTNTITTTNRGFLNQTEDTTNLTYLNNRYHDPQLAAFTSVDPLVGKTGHPYLYANGNPTTLTDPSGLEPGCGVTAAKAGKGACAVAHQTADLLSTAAVIRHSGDESAGPINSWFQTCTVVYSSCVDGTVDPTGGFGWDSDLGREVSANFRLAMWMLGVLIDFGLATVDGSGALVDGNGNLFTPTAWLDESGRLLASDKPPSGLSFTLGLDSGFCIFFCLEVGISGEGPYVKPGIGFAVDAPGLVVSNENPQCGTEETNAYVSVGIGPAQYSAGATSPGRSSDWSTYGPEFTGFGLPDGGAAPRYKIFSAGAGVVHEWTFC